MFKEHYTHALVGNYSPVECHRINEDQKRFGWDARFDTVAALISSLAQIQKRRRSMCVWSSTSATTAAIPVRGVEHPVSRRTASTSEVSLDEILYPSARKSDNGENVALFHKSSLVEIPYVEPETHFNVQTQEPYDSGYDYRVVETLPSVPPSDKKNTNPRRKLTVRRYFAA